MAAKENKAIKQLKKQMKKLKARIDGMSLVLQNLQDAADTTGIEQTVAELQEESVQARKPDLSFSEEEVEKAEELTEDAEEIADIIENQKKKRKGKKGKKKNR